MLTSHIVLSAIYLFITFIKSMLNCGKRLNSAYTSKSSCFPLAFSLSSWSWLVLCEISVKPWFTTALHPQLPYANFVYHLSHCLRQVYLFSTSSTNAYARYPIILSRVSPTWMNQAIYNQPSFYQRLAQASRLQVIFSCLQQIFTLLSLLIIFYDRKSLIYLNALGCNVIKQEYLNNNVIIPIQPKICTQKLSHLVLFLNAYTVIHQLNHWLTLQTYKYKYLRQRSFCSSQTYVPVVITGIKKSMHDTISLEYLLRSILAIKAYQGVT